MHYLSYKIWGCLTHNNSIVSLKNWELSTNCNEIMTNQDENKNKNLINTEVSFNFIHYMANLLV